MKLRLLTPVFALLAGSVAFANTFVATDSSPGDTRTAVTATGTPWRCVGKLSLPNHRFMTACLVGPNLILTAAHGLVKNGQLVPGNFVFRPDFGSSHNQSNDSATATRIWLGSHQPLERAFVHSDWAILQIDKDLGDAYGTLTVDGASDASLSPFGEHYYMAAYDKDFKHGEAANWQSGCGFIALDPLGYLLHDFSTTNGASGSPIFYFDGPDRARIVALNVAEKTPHSETLYAVPFTPQVANVAVPAREFSQTLSDILAGKSPASESETPASATASSPAPASATPHPTAYRPTSG